MSLKKPVRKRDPEYLAWIRQQPCVVSGLLAENVAIGHKIEAHHVRKSGHGGAGTKPDDSRTVPLVDHYHMQYHDSGKEAFELRYKVDLEAEILRLNREYAKLPKRETKKRELKPVVKVSVKHCPCKRDHELKPSALQYFITGAIEYMCPKLGWVKVERRVS